MHIIQKIFALFLASTLTLSISACSYGDDAHQSSTNEGSTVKSTDNIKTDQEAIDDFPWGNHTDLATFKNLIQDDDVVIVDVRTPQEFSQGHIPNALLIDVNNPDFVTKIQELDKDKTYAIYCRSGNRSRTAQTAMTDAGFHKTLGLNGGINVWDGDIE